MVAVFVNISKYFRTFSYFFALVSKKYCTFARGFKKCESNRDVAQLVAHYVRDVGVGRSSRLIPTIKKRHADILCAAFVMMYSEFLRGKQHSTKPEILQY